MYSLASTKSPTLHSELRKYTETTFVQTFGYDADRERYFFQKHEGGPRIHCCGLLSQIKRLYYPHIKDSDIHRQRRRRTRKRGSSVAQGKLVDRQILRCCTSNQSNVPKKIHPMTAALLEYWDKNDHVLQAAQLPVYLGDQWTRVTQADCITIHRPSGKLWMWEIKTGFPVGGSRRRGEFKAPISDVSCTLYNIWELQRHFTALALRKNGVPISQSRVIQVYKDSGTDSMVVTVKPPAKWAARLELPFKSSEYRPKVLGKTII